MTTGDDGEAQRASDGAPSSQPANLADAGRLPERAEPEHEQKTTNVAGPKARLWQRPVAWVGAVITALALAAATTFGSGLGNKLWSSATTPQPLRGIPVRIQAVSPLEFDSFASFVLPRELVLTGRQLAEMNHETGISLGSYASWFQRRGAVQALEGIINVTISSNFDAPVTIKELDVVKSCTSPPHGTLFSYVLGAGPQLKPQILFNLDQLVSVGQYGPPAFGKHPRAGGNFFSKEDVTVSPGEKPQSLSIYVTAAARFCHFTFNMQVITAAGVVTEHITNHGKPFALTGEARPKEFAAYYDTVASQQGAVQFVRVKPRL